VEGAGGSLHPVVTRVITRRLGAGFTILELLTVLTLAGLLLSLSVPSLLDMNRRLRVELASNELMSVLRTARSLAVRHSVNVALKFYPEPEGRVRFVLYSDGDGDGVLTRDIEAGIDPPESLPRELGHFGRMVHFGFPPGPPPWDPGNPRRRLENLEDPIRLNRSNMASFDPFGGSTPGSLYVTDGYSELAVVRILGRTGRVRILRYDRESEVWE
jgi:hypothetical protein